MYICDVLPGQVCVCALGAGGGETDTSTLRGSVELCTWVVVPELSLSVPDPVKWSINDTFLVRTPKGVSELMQMALRTAPSHVSQSNTRM